MNVYIKLLVTILFISLGFSACSNIQTPKFDLKKETYYFSAGFEEAGLSFYTQRPILSMKELEDRKNNFIKYNPSYDRYYYKVKSEKNKKVIYAYSLLTDRLMAILVSDASNRLVESKEFIDSNTTIKCQRIYTEKYQQLTSKEICTNGKTFIYNYVLNKKYKIYTHRTTLFYKDKKLIHKYMYKKDGTLLILNADGKLEKKETWIAESDLIPMFKK